MELQAKAFQIKGMSQDLSSPNIPNDVAYENYNIRIMTKEANSSGSLTNEKGPLLRSLKDLDFPNYVKGVALGYATFEDDLVIFSTDKGGIYIDIIHDSITMDIPTVLGRDDIYDNTTIDYIYHITRDNNNELHGKILYEGPLNFSIEHPIETQISVENEELKKVYWTDGYNIPRLINIEEDTYGGPSWQYDFIPSLSLEEEVTINKLVYGGQYYAGTLQYFFTYFNKYKQESNIFYQSPIYYCTDPTKGAAPDEQTTNAFEITINNIQQDFDYIRVYAIFRSSVNTPEARKIQDLDIKNSTSVSFVDTGEHYETVDLNDILFVGGQHFTADTLAINNTKLFLGNIKTPKTPFSKQLKDALKKASNIEFRYDYNQEFTRELPIKTFDFNINTDTFILNKSSFEATTFKVGQTYRFGIQFQDYKGVWSEVIYLGDKKITANIIEHSPGVYKVPVPVITFNDRGKFYLKTLKSRGYIKARPVVVFPEDYEREIICQGLIQPALTRMADIKSGRYNAFPSWYIRSYDGNLPFGRKAYLNYLHQRHRLNLQGNESSITDAKYPLLYHDGPSFITGLSYRDVSFEVQNFNSTKYYKILQSTEIDSLISAREEHILISPRTVTIHTPDIHKEEFSLNNYNCILSFIGKTKILNTYNNLLLQGNTTHLVYSEVESDSNVEDADTDDERVEGTFNKVNYGPKGNTFNTTYIGELNNKIISIPAWEDAIISKGDDLKDDKAIFKGPTNVGLWMVYPFNNNIYLTNISFWEKEIIYNKGLDFKSGILEKKIFSYNQFCSDYSIYDINNSKYIGNASSVNTIDNIKTLDAISHTYIDKLKSTLTYTESNNNKYLFSNNPTILYNNTVHFLLNLVPVNLSYFGRRVKRFLNSTNTNTTDKWLPLNTINIINDLGKEKIGNSPIYYRYAPAFIYKGNNTDPGNLTLNDTSGVSGKWYSSHNAQSLQTRISFKSGPYIVFVTNKGDNNKPEIYRNVSDSANGAWANVFNEISNSNIGGLTKGDIELGELRRDQVLNIFGGTSEDALSKNIWIPCGKATSLFNELYCLEGDTYFQKYECLKTYPDESNPQNGIVDIISFPCETYYNIEGRYDNNKYLTNPVYVEDSIFNKINPAYTQRDNFFVGIYMPNNRLEINTFPNQITWSRNKINGELIDTWTNTPLLNVLDLKLDAGKLTKLITHNNLLLGIHDSAIVQVRYNSNQQLTTKEGTPIELVATGNVEGYNTLIEGVGASDKHQVCKTPGGIVLFDSSSKDLYMYGQQLSNLSKTLGMHSWFQKFNKGKWSPTFYKIPTVQYDSINKEILVTSNKECLAYSFETNTFTSFYSYENIPYIINFKDSNYMIKNHSTRQSFLYEKHAGDYGVFFNLAKPYYTTVVLNENPLVSKILNNIEYSADFTDVKNPDKPISMDFNFTKLEVWNEYQKGIVNLEYINNKASSLEGKFRTWRIQAPRNNTALIDRQKKDRILGKWAFINLKREPNELNYDIERKHRMILHNIVVSYFS